VANEARETTSFWRAGDAAEGVTVRQNCWLADEDHAKWKRLAVSVAPCALNDNFWRRRLCGRPPQS